MTPSDSSNRRLLVTSALPYANGSIHLGHLVEYIQTDIWVRFHKLMGRECLYVCADDTHGTPIMIRAQREGIPPEELVARMRTEHQRDFAGFNIGFDNYHSTHSPENRALAEEIYLRLRQDGHIRTASVRQAYCEKDGMFLPDRFIRGICPSCGAADQYGDACESCSATYAPTDLKEARCAVCGSSPVARDSDHFFFKLADFETFLKYWIRSGAIQEQMANKLDEWFLAGLKDWDISRDGPYFGFEIPDAPNKFFYVWLDAPIGYMASTRHLCDRTGRDFDEIWRRDDRFEVHHFIGKDIYYFHTLFWPAMLHGAGFRLPTAVHAHGFLTINGQKMSKSRGSFLNARSYLDHLDPEYLRYYYAAKLSSRVEDLDLNLEDFTSRVNSDMVGKVVNIASRTAGFLRNRFGGKLAPVYPEDGGLFDRFVAHGEEIARHYEEREFGKAMGAVMRLAEEANRYVEQQSPWELAKKEGAEAALQASCSVALNLFKVLMTYLKPVLPAMADKVEAFLNVPPLSWENRVAPLADHEIGEFKHLMARVDPKKIEAMLTAARGESPPPPPAPAAAPATQTKGAAKSVEKVKTADSGAAKSAPAAAESHPGGGEIEIPQFSQVDLRVARIVAAESVEGADKLLKLTLDVGALGTRTVFAGIKSAYAPDALAGRLTVVVANLKPRKMKFGLSEGMVLAASGEGVGGLFLLQPDAGAEPGMRIK
ncbi:MAG: methionine--tRNA ligase [Magnetococcales bacterium]|nr:methionine--tRNA ligase [Magnetococcales bacterium]